MINPFMINIHCTVHRAALANSAAVNDTDKTAKYHQTVISFYKYFGNYYILELNCACDDNDIVSLKVPCSVRLPTLTCTVKVIKANLPALLMELDKDVARAIYKSRAFSDKFSI